MQRTWATDSDHDQIPLAWLSKFDDTTSLSYVTDALDAALAEDATVGDCQIGLLAVECIAYLRGGDADLHPQVHQWGYKQRPRIDDATRDLAISVIDHVRRSRLATYWLVEHGDRVSEWTAALDHLAERLRRGERLDDVAQPTPAELEALRDDIEAAFPHMRVALVAKVLDETDPSYAKVVAPGISLVLHYELPEKEPVAVPKAHVEAWGRAARNVWKHAAKRTREVARERKSLRIHFIESEHHEVTVVFGSDTFTAGMAPFVDMFLEEPAPHGVLMGLPFAGGFVFHRIVDGFWREAAIDVIEHIDKLFESEEPISKELFWWRDGALAVQPYQRIGDNVVITGTPEMLEVVGQLDEPDPPAKQAAKKPAKQAAKKPAKQAPKKPATKRKAKKR